jgi:hypothetical protein
MQVPFLLPGMKPMRFAGGTNGSETTRIREFGPGFSASSKTG